MKPTSEQRRYWDRVLGLGCLVTQTPYVSGRESAYRITLHHAHGGSLLDRGVTRSSGRKSSNWLVIPLIWKLHLGPGGIDGYPRVPVWLWEGKYRKQAAMLDEIVQRLGVDVWALARDEEKPMVPREAA